VLAAAAVTVLGLGIAALVWINGYQPLAFGGDSVYPPIAFRLHSSFDQNDVKFRQGKPFKVGVAVVNNGRFTVRVLGVTGEYAHSFAELPLSHRLLLMSGPMPKNGAPWVRQFSKFRPFDLPPGQTTFLQLNGTYHAHCRPWPGGESMTLAGFQVRYGFLWHKGKAQIGFPANLSIDFPENEHCLKGPPPPTR
jgi:hypothetical protein